MEKETDNAGKRQYKRLILFLVLLLGVAGAFILYAWWPLLTGKTIILATRPVDPFDLLQGQHIIINYEISNIPAIEGAGAGDTVYVILKEDAGGIWRYQSASLEPPKEGMFLRGTLVNNGRVEYGISKYFFEKDAQFPTRNITVEVKVGSSGDARISNLLQNGKPIEVQYRNLRITS